MRVNLLPSTLAELVFSNRGLSSSTSIFVVAWTLRSMQLAETDCCLMNHLVAPISKPGQDRASKC